MESNNPGQDKPIGIPTQDFSKDAPSTGAVKPKAMDAQGAVGKQFEADGAIGSIGQAVGGPLAADGMIGKQFTKDGAIGGTIQNNMGGVKKA
ncbi:hypothetical protein MCOR25_001820 [Pyricularia grisea]|uniref:Uncharacterized protein n=1 Tax=Pyricularia grisea TaxID=148305 RepID=A0A6P8B6F2_PYRGI|nr:hypothetical protein PgNI_05283 [Pyricularia grisea]KAI6380169.1 hypothetical protein MCOR25_001820 [Pyricularia grisea]TLD10916.1 hypothetical protein PgNI_05283 [Pyricularia grisea]